MERKKVSPQEFAEILGVDGSVIYRALQNGRLVKSKRPGKNAKSSLIEVTEGVLEWFEKIDFHMVLWWIEHDRRPTVEEAKIRLELLRQNGPTYSAFTLKRPFPAPSGKAINPFTEECA